MDGRARRRVARWPSHRFARVRNTDDAGLTLAELLVSVAMVGVAFAVIVSGMYTYTTSSGSHRSQADVQVQLRNYAEAVVNAPYVGTCPTASYTVATYSPPAGFTATNAVMLWNPATLAFDITPAAGCTDPKLQRVRLSVTKTGTYPYTETLDVVKRDPTP